MRTQQISDDQLVQLRTMLIEQRTFRTDQLAQLHVPGNDGPFSSSVPDVFSELAAGARSALRDVRAALTRMDDGSYGSCTTCGGEVGLHRLEILPQAAQCPGCQRASAGRAVAAG